MYCHLNSNVSVKWQKYFYDHHFGINHITIRCLFSELIPIVIVILFNFYIFSHIIQTYQHLYRKNSYYPHKRQIRTISWMNIVLIFHSSLFLASLTAHIIGHFISMNVHEIWWVCLIILMNCSLNFYLYCLSGKAFRNEIYRLIRRCKSQIIHTLHLCFSQRRRSSESQSSIYEMTNFEILIQQNNISFDHRNSFD